VQQLLEPWVFLRLVAGLVATALLVRASITAISVIRRFDVMRATEGQLALERRMELAGTFVRVGAIAQVVALLLSALAADKLSRGIRGAMCAYGTFNSTPWGFRAFTASVVAALAAGTVAQLFAFDSRVRGMELAKPLAWATLIVAPIAAIDFILQLAFVLDLDLSVVASCCSVQLDAVAAARGGTATGPRLLSVALASIAGAVCVGLAVLCARRPRRPLAVLTGAAATIALPLAVAAVILEVAPYAFEIPQHHCPFCLLRGSVGLLGYPLFGALLTGAIWLFGAATSAMIARAPALLDAWRAFAASRARRGAIAWAVCAALCVLPIVRYAIVTHGASLFP
jgi:hypothetical protein